jgi:hypothetical protein
LLRLKISFTIVNWKNDRSESVEAIKHRLAPVFRSKSSGQCRKNIIHAPAGFPLQPGLYIHFFRLFKVPVQSLIHTLSVLAKSENIILCQCIHIDFFIFSIFLLV